MFDSLQLDHGLLEDLRAWPIFFICMLQLIRLRCGVETSLQEVKIGYHVLCRCSIVGNISGCQPEVRDSNSLTCSVHLLRCGPSG